MLSRPRWPFTKSFPRARKDTIVPVAGPDQVVTAPAIDPVVTAASQDDVSLGGPVQDLTGGGAGERRSLAAEGRWAAPSRKATRAASFTLDQLLDFNSCASVVLQRDHQPPPPVGAAAVLVPPRARQGVGRDRQQSAGDLEAQRAVLA